MWIFPLFATAAVLALAYVFMRWLSGKNRSFMGGRHIRVIERAALGQDRYLALVKVGERIYLLGVTGQGVSSIDSFSASDFQDPPEPPAGADFTQILGRVLTRRTDAKGGGGRKSDEE